MLLKIKQKIEMNIEILYLYLTAHLLLNVLPLWYLEFTYNSSSLTLASLCFIFLDTSAAASITSAS